MRKTSEVKEQGEADTPSGQSLTERTVSNSTMLYRGLERSQTLQVLLFILWVTSVGLHFPIDRFFRGFSEKAILSGICQMFILDISV